MAVVKTQCPECDAKIRLTAERAGTQKVECLKCGHAFTARAEPDAGAAQPNAPAKKSGGSKETVRAGAPAKKTKAVARRDDDDDDRDEDAAPKKKKKKGAAADGQKQKLLIAGVVAGVLVLGGVAAVVVAVSGNKNRTAKSDTPAPATAAPTAPAPTNSGTAGTTPVKPAPKGGNAGTPAGSGDVSTPAKKEPEDKEPEDIVLPKRPVVKIDQSFVPPPGKPIVRLPVIPPVAPDEDPFVRAKDFKPDAALPELPKLPDRQQRPILSLNSGGHTAFLSRVFFTPDGNRVVTIAEDKAVRIWDLKTNTTLRTLRFPAGPGREGSLLAAAVSRSGKRLAVAGEPILVKGEVPQGKVPVFVVNPDTGAPISRIDKASHVVLSMHFSNDGNRLAVGCADGTLHVFHPVTGTQLGSLQAPGAVLEIKFNPQPTTSFIAAIVGGQVLMANLKSNQILPLQFNGGRPFVLAWSNDGKYLAVGCTNGVIGLFDAGGKPVKNLPAVTVARKVRVQAADGTDTDTEKEIQLPVQFWGMQFLPDDRDIAVVGTGNYAAIIDSNTGGLQRAFTGHNATVFAMDVAPDGKRIVSGGGTKHEALVWGAGDGKLLNRLEGEGAAISALGWAKDGKSLAWGTQPRSHGDPKDLPLEQTFRLDEFGLGGKPDESKYSRTVTSDDGVTLNVGFQRFLVTTPGRPPALISLGNGTIYSATLLPKGNAVVCGGVTDITLVNPTNGRPSSNPFIGHAGNVTCIAPHPEGRYFATGATDQTIRIWRRDVEEPLLSIFVAGRDWIAWTPQGYYACSAQGERLITWQLNSAAGSAVGAAAKAPQTHPAERFRPSLYQPALLKYLIPAGDLPRAMAMAQKFDKALVATTNIADVIPPEVTLDGFGETELKVEKEVLTVRATAKSGKHGVKSMRLLVDGRPYKGKEGIRTFDKPDPGADATATWDVPLDPGTHTVAVIADTGVSRGMSKVGLAVRSGDPPRPNLYVLAMGVSKYPAGVNSLTYCATDAQMLAAAFQKYSKPLFDEIEVKILPNELCTKKGMREGLDWLKSKMKSKDVGIVTFSGHGSRDLGGGFYLVPADVDPSDDSNRSCMSGEEFKSRLDAMPGRLVAILDACHSGTVGDDGKKPPRADALVRELTAEDSGVIVMCASLGREYAIESGVCKAGFYTLALVEGMEGSGDVDGDGVIYLHELDLYASKRVQQLSHGAQNPTFSRPASVRPFPIAKPDKPPEP